MPSASAAATIADGSDRAKVRARPADVDVAVAAPQRHEQDRRLEPGPGRDRERQPVEAVRPDRQVGHGHVHHDRADRGDDRRERVLLRIEGAGEDGDHRVGRQADEQHEQHRRRHLHGRLVEVRVLEQQVDDLPAQDHPERRDRQHHEHEQAQRPADHPEEARHGSGRELGRQGRQEHDPERHADDPERDLQQEHAEVERRQRACLRAPWPGS